VKKFIFISLLMVFSLFVLVAFAYIFFGIFHKIGVDLSDQEIFREITSLFLASFAIVTTLITLFVNLVYARNRSIVDRNSSVKPLVLLSKAMPSDKFYSDYRLRLTLPDNEGSRRRDYQTFKCTVHNHGLGIAQKLVFIGEAGGSLYKAEGVLPVLHVNSEVSITLLYNYGRFQDFSFYLGFRDVYGNLYFVTAINSMSSKEEIFGEGGNVVSGDTGLLIEESSKFFKFRRLKNAYLGNSTTMLD